MKRVIHALATVLLVCVGVRLAAALVTPLIPVVAVALVASLLGALVFRSPH